MSSKETLLFTPDSFDSLAEAYDGLPFARHDHDLYFAAAVYDPAGAKDGLEPFVEAYFPFPGLFPLKDARLFCRFCLGIEGPIRDADGNPVVFPKNAYIRFVVVYDYYKRAGAKRIRSKSFTVWNAERR